MSVHRLKCSEGDFVVVAREYAEGSRLMRQHVADNDGHRIGAVDAVPVAVLA